MSYWPRDIVEYVDAIGLPSVAFRDSELTRGVVSKTRDGRILSYAGGLGIVFRLECATKKYAVKCFRYPQSDRLRRFLEIDKYLTKSSLDCMVGFRLIDSELLVTGNRFPVLKMEWVNAPTLDMYIKMNLANPQKLQTLAEDWLALIGSLRQNQISHGDLQNANIMVDNGRLKLIDYDGMYVPSIASLGTIELGQTHFQHPDRILQRIKPSPFGPNTDNFSAWVIYLSIVALSIDSSLWSKCECGPYNLLFTGPDYQTPDASPKFKLLRSHSNKTIAELTEKIFQYSKAPFDHIPPLIDSPNEVIKAQKDRWWTSSTEAAKVTVSQNSPIKRQDTSWL